MISFDEEEVDEGGPTNCEDSLQDSTEDVTQEEMLVLPTENTTSIQTSAGRPYFDKWNNFRFKYSE